MAVCRTRKRQLPMNRATSSAIRSPRVVSASSSWLIGLRGWRMAFRSVSAENRRCRAVIVLLLGRADTRGGKAGPAADRAHERGMAGDAREHHAIDCAEREVSSNGGRECVDEPGRGDGVEGIEAVLPPQPENAEAPRRAVGPGLDTAHEAVAEQDRQDVVAPSSFRGGNVDLPHVVEVEQATEQVTIPDDRVERREE